MLNGRSEISVELLDSFKDYQVKVAAISGDVSQFDDAKRMVDEAIAKLGSVDILVNNAGITHDKLMLKMTEAGFESVLKSGSDRCFQHDTISLETDDESASGCYY